jgi:hypothetical protein
MLVVRVSWRKIAPMPAVGRVTVAAAGAAWNDSNADHYRARCAEHLQWRVDVSGTSVAALFTPATPMRFASKNMCSVRQSPMPSAPNLIAARASAGGDRRN